MEKTGSKLTNLSDKQLIQLALIKDQQAFAMLLDKYKYSLIAFILQYVQIKEDAEDICQRSFEKAFMNISKYDSKHAFSTWLYKIAKNEAIDHIRREKQVTTSLDSINESDILSTGGNEDPEEKVIIDQIVSNIISGIMSLPETYKEVAEMRFIKDYAYEDIAETLNIPLGTVKTRLNRARKMLSELISQ